MRICFFGDSLTNGTGDDDALGWPGRLVAMERKRGRDITYYNLGIRRDTSSDIRERWEDEARRRLPAGLAHRLAFSFGTNDCVMLDEELRVPFAQSLENAAAILTRARAMAPVIMIGPPPLLRDTDEDARVKTFSDAIRALSAELGVPFLETWSIIKATPLWKAEAEADAGDGAHPNAGGYSALASHIGAWDGWSAWLDGR